MKFLIKSPILEWGRSVLLAILSGGMANAQILDTVVVGDNASESAHGATMSYATAITGGLGQPARKIFPDPADTTSFESGYVQLTLKCDPIADNFVTLKLWGSDWSRNSGGRILLYQIQDGQMNQVGFRDIQSGEYSPLAWGGVFAPPIPNRFYYSTIPLPLSMTQGRTSVTLRVVGSEVGSLGSPGIYRVYVHQGSYFEPAPGDPQAPVPAPAPIRPPGPTSMAEAVARDKAATDAAVSSAIANGGGDPGMMLRAYKDPTSPGYQNSVAIKRAADGYMASLDQTTRDYFQDPNRAGGEWGGSYGNQGIMVSDVGAAGYGSRLDQVVDLGDPAGSATRRLLWGKMLKASRDNGRFWRQGPTSAQSMIGDNNIYKANKGLQALGSADALPETQAIRYLLEAAGVEPWRGSDKVEGGSWFPMGTNYYEVSPAGLTKENGYVSAYGEVYDIAAGYYGMSGDTRLRDQVVKMLKARSYLRYPMVDADGYRCFQMVGPLDWRSHQTFPIDTAYGERGSRLSVAPNTNDPAAVGFAKQMFEDNQGGTQASQQMLDWDDSGIRLPMTEGQPDFAWADVDNGLIAIKRGEELTWIETYWQARGGIHSAGRAMQITPTSARVAHIRLSTQFDWNGYWRAQGDTSQWGGSPYQSHLGVVHQAYANEKILEAKAPSYAPGSRREEFIGRASFYATRYGRYLVGINMDPTKSYVLKTPPGFTSAQDLITKTTKSGTVTVGPFSAVVLDLGANVETAPIPNSTRFISSKGMQGGISINWDTSGGATTYNLKRSTTSGGPYTTLASGLGATYPKKWGAWPFGAYVDTTAVIGTTYYYIVAGVNPNGEGYSSPESPGATRLNVPSVNALPAPWANVNFSAGGSASHNAGTFTLTGGGGDVWWGSDGGHFVYRPLPGDGALVARLTNTGGAYKCGLMIRQTLDGGSPHVMLTANNTNVGGLRRDTPSEWVEYVPGSAGGLSVPKWLKLERVGRTAIFSHAPDVSGAPGTWVAFAYQGLETSDGNAYIGLYTTSGSPTFDNVTGPLYGNRLPAAPDTPIAAAGNALVAIAWSPADQAATYSVRRATTPGGPYNTVVASNLTVHAHTDTSVTNGTTYYYVITATNTTGTGPNSAQASAMPLATPPPPANLTVAASGTQAVLNWSASGGATSYTVLRSLDGVNWTSVATGVTGTTYKNTGLAALQTYFYSVQAVNGNGASAAATSVTATSAPTVPWLRTADSVGTQAKLRWDTVGGAASYKVWRASTLNGTYTTIASNVSSSSYTDSGLTPGGEYYYKISAVNASGESAQSGAIKLGWGTGLLGNYYNSTNFSGTSQLARLDPIIVFNWGQAPPVPGMYYDFSVRWTGQLEAPVTDTYTFTGYADDNIQAYINGTPVVNNGTINLVAGQKYGITVEFRDTEGAAYFNLFWSSPSFPQENLPTSRLYPAVLGQVRSTGGTASASNQNPSEPAANAFDGNVGSKWNIGVNGSTGWLAYRFAGGAALAVSEYRLTSANDVPGRDPRDWQFQGSSNGIDWTTLDTRTGETFSSRFQTKSYPITNTTAYAYHRLNITANVGGSGSSLQLAEFTLFSPVPLPSPPASLALVPDDKKVTASWSPVAGATAYLVRRSIYDGGPYTPVARVTSGTSFVDTKLVNDTRYYYVVSTASADGEGANSAQSSALVIPAIEDWELRGAAFQMAGGNIALTLVASVPGRTYQLQRSFTLLPDSWTDVGEEKSGGGTLIFTDTLNEEVGKAFYRIYIGP